MSKSKSSPGEILSALIIGVPLAFVVSVFLTGWGISKLWGWFVTDLFGLPPLTIWSAYGLSLVASLFTSPAAANKNDDDLGPWGIFFVEVLKHVFRVGIAVGLGWIASHYV